MPVPPLLRCQLILAFYCSTWALPWCSFCVRVCSAHSCDNTSHLLKSFSPTLFDPIEWLLSLQMCAPLPLSFAMCSSAHGPDVFGYLPRPTFVLFGGTSVILQSVAHHDGRRFIDLRSSRFRGLYPVQSQLLPVSSLVSIHYQR